jgi:hypothetical protein
MKATIEDLNKMATDYFLLHRNNGGASEFDKSINDISRAKIMVLNEIWDKVFMYKINLYDNETIHCFEYTGQKIYNFSFDFVLDHENKELIDMMENPKGYIEFERIFDKAESLGAIYLQWS